MNLQLSLKRKWFDMTKAGIKTEDYREITPYWCNKLLHYGGTVRNRVFWEDTFFFTDVNNDFYLLKSALIGDYADFKQFSINTMTLGYPKAGDPERTLIYEHAGIEIRTGNPEWGAAPDKLYFVIKHGNIIK